jgi:hypothetical protein
LKVKIFNDVTSLEQDNNHASSDFHQEIKGNKFPRIISKTLELHENIETISLGIERSIETGVDINVPEPRIQSAPLVPRY